MAHFTISSRAFWLLSALLWLALVGALIHAGFQPDDYRLSHGEARILPYPTGSVINFALIIFAEIVVLGLIVQPWRLHRLWLRLLICALPWMAWTYLWALAAMHQPPVRDVHSIWLLVVSIVLFLANLHNLLNSITSTPRP